MRLLAVLTLALLASFPTCSRFRTVVMTEEQSGTTLELKRGQEFGVRLKVNSASDHFWYLVDRGGAVMVGKPVTANSVSGESTQLWRFRADSVRGGTLKLEYKRKEKDAVPVERFTVTLKVSLVGR